jgi:hypothetical protein
VTRRGNTLDHQVAHFSAKMKDGKTIETREARELGEKGKSWLLHEHSFRTARRIGVLSRKARWKTLQLY